MIKGRTKRLFALVLTLWATPALRGQALLQGSDFSAEIVDTTRGDRCHCRPKKRRRLHAH
jgi:hypothetical protein